MPPANSLAQGTPSLSPVAPASSLQQLGTISIPVPNLSATLINRAEDGDVHEDNVNFLRTNGRSPRDPSASRQRRRRQQYLAESENDRMDLDDPWGLGINSDAGSRIRWVNHQREGLSNMPNYDGRRMDLMSFYDWALGDNDSTIEFIQEFLANEPESARNGTPRRHGRRESSNRTPTQPVEGGSSHRSSDATIPTDALLQSVRRHPRFSRTRTLHNYVVDRDRVRDRDRDRESENRDRPAASTSRAYRYLPTSRAESRILTHNDLRSRIRAHRQLYMDYPRTPQLKETIKYLERLRYSNSYEESLTSAAAGGFIQLDYFASNEDDFILDTASLAPPTECSWLRPGMAFSGSQRAARTGDPMFPYRLHPSNDPVIVNGSETGRVTVHTTSGRRYLPQNLYRVGGNKDENWPVKVTIHSVNYKDMTLSGTMEAYNIPDKTSLTPEAHIITYLEGEIIDFNKYTLETGKFKADAETDSTYWRELQPFKYLTDDEMVKNLVSRKWITEELSKGWILMRWKEQCFVTPPRDAHSRQILTISGFYYISLRRDNGHIEGLYYDPGSSPYQQLSLNPETSKMVCPSYRFR